MSTSHRTGGQQAVDALVRSGIRQAFTVPGESFLGLLDALRDSPIRLTATRHEGGAAFMAEAYGQLTGEPALCLATRAVGASNLSIGLHTARQDSTPLVAIVGQVPRAYRGREAFQEIDQVETFGRLCKAAVEVDEPRRLDTEITRMVGLARGGRPGPVLISIPEDVLAARAPTTARSVGELLESVALEARGWLDLPERPAPSPEEVEAVLELLATARRPVILGGAGILRSGAVNLLRAFSELTGLPVIAAWRRPDVFANDLPQYLGMTGLGAARTVEPRLMQADVILAIGTRLSEIATFRYRVPGRSTRLIHVDIEPGLSGDRAQPALAIRADARAFLRRALETTALAQRLGIPDLVPSDRLTASRAADLARDRAAYVAAVTLPERARRPAERLGKGRPGGVDPAVVVAALERHLDADAILTTDAGNFASWAARYVPIREGGRFLGPTSGAMGYGLPAAVGAAIAAQGGAAAAELTGAEPTMAAARTAEGTSAEPPTADARAAEVTGVEPPTADARAAEVTGVEPPTADARAAAATTGSVTARAHAAVDVEASEADDTNGGGEVAAEETGVAADLHAPADDESPADRDAGEADREPSGDSGRETDAPKTAGESQPEDGSEGPEREAAEGLRAGGAEAPVVDAMEAPVVDAAEGPVLGSSDGPGGDDSDGPGGDDSDGPAGDRAGAVDANRGGEVPTPIDAEPVAPAHDLAHRRQVVALAGDGGFAMLMAELETAVREHLRLAVLVFDNEMYGTIRMHQETAHPGRIAATDLGPIDFAAVAEACGARALRVERDADVETAIADALGGDGVTLVHLRVDPGYLSIDRRLPHST